MRGGFPIVAIKTLTTLPTVLGLLMLSSPASAQPEESGPSPEEGPARQQTQLTLDDLRTFTDVFNQVRKNYVEEVGDQALLDAAIRGMLHELDPHSSYLPQSDYQDLSDNSRGRYSGIGIDVGVEDQRIVVRAVIDGSPADQAGINPGDIIMSIDGVPVRGRNLSEAIDSLKGDPGTRFRLTLLNPVGEERELELRRAQVQVPTLSFQLLENDFGYYRISHFHKQTAAHLEQSLNSVAGEGIVLQGLVLDLRNNPGGVLEPAIAIADGFLDDGLIVSTRGRNAAMQMEFSAQPGQWLPELPLIVIVDRGSASASEVLAGALQDNRRAWIIGERTFGKGSVQSVLPLRNGGGIKLTTARYYTPSGRSIQAEGIIPHVVIETGDSKSSDGRKREADLDRHLEKAEPGSAAEAGSTPALEANSELEHVLEALRSAGILSEGNGTAVAEEAEASD
jgi:carboxyl-terminal processing protease